MAEDLQALLDRIQRDGVERARQESEKILADARREAERIVEEARQRAAAIESEAERKAMEARVRGEEALRQAARDVLISLRGRLQERLRSLVRAAAAEAMDPPTMARVIAELARAYADSGMQVERIEVLLPAERLDEIREKLLAALKEDLKRNTELSPVSVEGGFQLIFNNEDVVYDFSDEALADALTSFLNPTLAELIRSADAPDSAGDVSAKDEA